MSVIVKEKGYSITGGVDVRYISPFFVMLFLHSCRMNGAPKYPQSVR